MGKKVSGTKRITVILSDDVIKKLRKMQAELIRETLSTVTLSSVINKILREHNKKI